MNAWVLFAALFFSDGRTGYIGPFVAPTEAICRQREMIVTASIEARGAELHTWETWCLPVNLGSGI